MTRSVSTMSPVWIAMDIAKVTHHVLIEAGRVLVLPRPLQETCEEVLRFVEKAIPANRLILLLRENATVTVCHRRTRDLAREVKAADIVVVAAGRPGLVTGDMLRRGAVVVDIGINVVDGKLVGDVDFASASLVAGAITPVPGGVGPVTNALLLTHVMRAARAQAAVEGGTEAGPPRTAELGLESPATRAAAGVAP